ncbi:MAG: prepilin-type N-terminal cleavage/methylation domain-containing protein [Gammaproteobacteria bacterium]
MSLMRRNGFTLIEVLIAMTLLSLMVVLLFSSLRTAAQSWTAGENKVVEVNNKAVVYQFFKSHLNAMRPLPMFPDATNPEVALQQAFQGYTQSIRFVAALPAASARKGLQLFTIALNPDDRSMLMVSLVPYREADADADRGPDKPEVLLENVDGLKFSYYGKMEDVAPLQWRDEWTQADRLPSLIKVSIALGDGSDWPDMVFAPRIQGGHSEIIQDNNGNQQFDNDVF